MEQVLVEGEVVGFGGFHEGIVRVAGFGAVWKAGKVPVSAIKQDREVSARIKAAPGEKARHV